MSYYVGVDLGGTKIFLALADQEGKIIRKQKIPTGAESGPHHILRRLIDNVEAMVFAEGVSFRELAGMGISTAGFFDTRSGNIVSSPNLPGWEMFPLAKELRELLQIPVLVENDANAAAYGEYVFGAGKGKRNILNITLGTGIGGGIITEGRLYRGSGGFAGEIGHLIVLPQGPLCGCGRYGCLESLSSGTAIEREGRALLTGERPTALKKMVAAAEQLTANHVFIAAREGDREAKKIVEQAAFFLGLALSYAVNLLNPDVIILGGGMALTGEILFEPLRRYIKETAITPSMKMVSVVPAALGEEAGLRGILGLLADFLKK